MNKVRVLKILGIACVLTVVATLFAASMPVSAKHNSYDITSTNTKVRLAMSNTSSLTGPELVNMPQYNLTVPHGNSGKQDVVEILAYSVSGTWGEGTAIVVLDEVYNPTTGHATYKGTAYYRMTSIPAELITASGFEGTVAYPVRFSLSVNGGYDVVGSVATVWADWRFLEGMGPFANASGKGSYASITPGGPIGYTGTLYFK